MLEIFFFFQAEDGIRDVAVTGVQTCALPICRCRHRIWAGCSGEIAPDRTAATLLEAGSPARRRAGCSRPRTSICAVSEPRPYSLGVAWQLRDPKGIRSEEHTSELQSRLHLVCRLLLEKKKTYTTN